MKDQQHRRVSRSPGLHANVLNMKMVFTLTSMGFPSRSMKVPPPERSTFYWAVCLPPIAFLEFFLGLPSTVEAATRTFLGVACKLRTANAIEQYVPAILLVQVWLNAAIYETKSYTPCSAPGRPVVVYYHCCLLILLRRERWLAMQVK